MLNVLSLLVEELVGRAALREDPDELVMTCLCCSQFIFKLDARDVTVHIQDRV